MTMFTKCTHCNEDVLTPFYIKNESDNEIFCCTGCKTVYQILKSRGLEEYYTIRSESSSEPGSTPIQLTGQKYTYLDQTEFQEQYTFRQGESTQMRFYLEGVHCLACLWLLEKIPEFLKGVESTKLDFSKSILNVSIDETTSFSIVARELELLGYRPHPLKNKEGHEEYQGSENRKDLIRIGIAGFSAGNVMLYSLAIYAGAKGENANLFNWWGFVVALPTLLYSAVPFYKSAWYSLKNRAISIDVPIVIAILLGSLTGFINLINGNHEVYFDSLVTLIFLLLSARYILKRAQQQGLSSSDLSSFFSDIIARRLNNDQFEEVHTSLLKKDEIIEVRQGETIPADGKISFGNGYVNLSILSGESVPQKVSVGDNVYFGSKYDGNNIHIKVSEIGDGSRLGKLLKEIEKGWNQTTHFTRISDTIAKYLVGTVFTLSLMILAYFYWQGDTAEGLRRMLTLVIITCPCALGLTTPLAFTLTLSKLAKKGIVIKDEAVLERLLKIKDIFFDKTGTLTHGNFEVSSSDIDEEYASHIFAMEKISRHPIAKAICLYLENNFDIKNVSFQDLREVYGHGILADNYELCSRKNDTLSTEIVLLVDGDEKAYFELKDTIREDSKEIIEEIQSLSIKPYLLTGDKKPIAASIASQAGINEIIAEASPEKKGQVIKDHPHSMMVGDGVNDALALSNSSVGVAVHSSVDISLRAADIYLSRPSLYNIVRLIKSARKTIKIVKINLTFSLAYNFIGVYLAMTGNITPLVAAILMPLSSLTVLFSTMIGSRKVDL